MASIEFHSLYWPGTNTEIIEMHKLCMASANVKVNYHELRIDHGVWMTNVVERAKSDIVCFFDIDCVPISRKFWEPINRLQKSKTFFGIAQVSNHIPPATHIYAAPAFFGIHKECWNKVNHSFVQGSNKNRVGDVCELFCYEAEDMNIPYELIMPTYYYKPSSEGVWNLADEGTYGIGTIFEDMVYHLYQSRFAENVELFKKHTHNILRCDLNYDEFIRVEPKQREDNNFIP